MKVSVALEKVRSSFLELRTGLDELTIGYGEFKDALCVALLRRTLGMKGNILVYGPPGVAKTTTVKSAMSLIAQLNGGLVGEAGSTNYNFVRVQGRSDLTPEDFISRRVAEYDEQGKLHFIEKLLAIEKLRADNGSLFPGTLYVGELDKIPGRAVFGLLEAMEEQQVTLPSTGSSIPIYACVVADANTKKFDTQAQVIPRAIQDRFSTVVFLNYLSVDDDLKVLNLVASGVKRMLPTVQKIDMEAVRVLQQWVAEHGLPIGASEVMKRGCVTVVKLTQKQLPRYTDFSRCIKTPSGPRGYIDLYQEAMVQAILAGSDVLQPEHCIQVGVRALRGRIEPAPEAELEDKTADTIIAEILEEVFGEMPRQTVDTPVIPEEEDEVSEAEKSVEEAKSETEEIPEKTDEAEEQSKAESEDGKKQPSDSQASRGSDGKSDEGPEGEKGKGETGGEKDTNEESGDSANKSDSESQSDEEGSDKTLDSESDKKESQKPQFGQPVDQPKQQKQKFLSGFRREMTQKKGIVRPKIESRQGAGKQMAQQQPLGSSQEAKSEQSSDAKDREEKSDEASEKESITSERQQKSSKASQEANEAKEDKQAGKEAGKQGTESKEQKVGEESGESGESGEGENESDSNSDDGDSDDGEQSDESGESGESGDSGQSDDRESSDSDEGESGDRSGSEGDGEESSDGGQSGESGSQSGETGESGSNGTGSEGLQGQQGEGDAGGSQGNGESGSSGDSASDGISEGDSDGSLGGDGDPTQLQQGGAGDGSSAQAAESGETAREIVDIETLAKLLAQKYATKLLKTKNGLETGVEISQKLREGSEQKFDICAEDGSLEAKVRGEKAIVETDKKTAEHLQKTEDENDPGQETGAGDTGGAVAGKGDSFPMMEVSNLPNELRSIMPALRELNAQGQIEKLQQWTQTPPEQRSRLSVEYKLLKGMAHLNALKALRQFDEVTDGEQTFSHAGERTDFLQGYRPDLPMDEERTVMNALESGGVLDDQSYVHEQRITTDAPHLVFVMDTSGSMKKGKRMASALASARAICLYYGPRGATFGVLQFCDNPNAGCRPPESDTDRVIDAILMCSPNGGTAYAPALELAFQLALPNTTVLCFGDFEDSSKLSNEALGLKRQKMIKVIGIIADSGHPDYAAELCDEVNLVNMEDPTTVALVALNATQKKAA